jgi:hypothetical protein
MIELSIPEEVESIPFSVYHGLCSESYLFGSEFIGDQRRSNSFPLLTSQNKRKFLKIKKGDLIVLPFRIKIFGQMYINSKELPIDLSKIKSGIYQIIVVHNFQVEDTNPNLKECLAGIYLSKQVGGEWEKPENRTIECRSIEILALLTRKKGSYFIHDYK